MSASVIRAVQKVAVSNIAIVAAAVLYCRLLLRWHAEHERDRPIIDKTHLHIRTKAT